MNYKIIGTAGHIDHGKTTLIEALTGIDTDRLKEEKDRGISIDLGFSYMDIDGVRVGIVDVPGHEALIKNMMSGAVGFDLVLLVVAADDGVMPQTVEHIKILESLRVSRGLVVITKVSTVDEELVELVEMDIMERLEGTFLEDAPIIKVDSVDCVGLDELKSEITKSLKNDDDTCTDDPFRLNIDRAFNIKGHGTVVTGTVAEGSIATGDEIIHYPIKNNLEIRSIQVHGETVESASKSQRVALNVTGITHTDIDRGDILSEIELLSTDMIDCYVDVDIDSPEDIRHWTRVRVFVGTREVIGRCVPLSGPVIERGTSGIVQIRLEEEINPVYDQPFVLRRFSPVDIVGGGHVLNPTATRNTYKNTEYLESLNYIKENDLYGFVETLIKIKNHTDLPSVQKYTGKGEELLPILRRLCNQQKILQISNVYIDMDYYEDIKERIIARLEKFHRENPLEKGINTQSIKEELKIDLDQREYVEVLESYDVFEIDVALIRLKSFKVTLDDNEKQQIKTILEEIKSQAPNLAPRGDYPQELIDYLVRNKEIHIIEDRFISDKTLQSIIKYVLEFIDKNGSMEVVDLRDHLEIGRKATIEILEYLDQLRITKRVYSERVRF